MAEEEGFDIGRDLPVFLASVLDKMEYICQNDEGEGAAEAHAKVIDQSIRMLRSIRDLLLFLMAKGFHHDLWHLGTEQVQFLQDCLNYISETLFFLKSHLYIRE